MSQSVFQPRLIALAMGCVSLSATAQTVITQLDPVVVVGERAAPLSETLASVTVIDRAQIEAAHANDIAELLQGQAGMEVARPGPPGSPISVYIRGGASTHALVLLDGIPFYSESATGSSSPLEIIPLDLIEKIEIVPGGVPNIKGLTAPGGIIAITTRTAQDGASTQHYAAMVGSRSSGSLSAFRRWREAGSKLSLNASRQYTGGYGAINPQKYTAVNPGANPAMRNSVSLGWAHDLNVDTQVGVNLMQTRADVSWDNAWANAKTDDWLSRSKAEFNGVFVQSQLTPQWFARWDLQSALNESATLTNEVVNTDYGIYSTRHQLASWRNEYQLSPQTLLKAGLSHDRTQYTDSYLALDEKQVRASTVFGVEQKWGKALTTLDVSRVSDQKALAYLNRGLGAMYPLSDAWALMGQHNVTHRLPTIGELKAPSFGGNVNLKAERIKSSQLAIQFKGAHDLHRLTWFNAIYNNKIAAGQTLVDDPVWAAWGVKKLENIASSHNAGVEWSWRHQHKAWTWATSFTVQQPQVDGANTLLKNLSHQFGAVDVAYRFTSGDALSLKWFARSSQYNANPAGGNAFSAGYAVTKLGWSRPLGRDLTAQISVDNFFDRAHEPVAGFNGPPRGVFVAVHYQPKP